MLSRHLFSLVFLTAPLLLVPPPGGEVATARAYSVASNGVTGLHDDHRVVSILGVLDRVAIEGPCDYYCQDCANPEREWTHSWPNGGYNFSGDPACQPDTDCGALGCKASEEDEEEQVEVEADFLSLVSMLQKASPEVLATVIETSDGLITLNEARGSVQVRRCPERIVANLPIEPGVLAKLRTLAD